jgi:DNA polymerase III subunit epsilon
MPLRGRRPRPPRRATHSLAWRRAVFASLDFETTGLDYERDAILSFGVVPVVSGRVLMRGAVDRLVATGVPASPASMKVHGIMPRELADAVPPSAAADTLRALLDGRFLLAWYAEVEIAFLARLFGTRRRAWARRAVDVRALVLELERRSPSTHNTLAGSAARYGIPVASPHDALDDALVAAQLFLVVAARLEADGRGRVRDLLRISRRAGTTRT